MFILSGFVCNPASAWEILQPGNVGLETCSCMPVEVPQAMFWPRKLVGGTACVESVFPGDTSAASLLCLFPSLQAL